MTTLPLFAAQAPAARPIDRGGFVGRFRSIAPQDIPGNVFTLVGAEYYVITAGTPERYNSMVAGWGGWGILFNEPAVWAFLRASRYTLEIMRQCKTFTFSHFPAAQRSAFMLFGSKSGRDSQKMEEHTLQAVLTPGGRIAYAEAKLIIECDLSQITTVAPDDFLVESSAAFVKNAHADAGAYHKLVFGKIADVWMPK
ncbi:MAG: flavin reductase [Deltaproteobacteria bacterium]|nr:flavin reductase [Deltaproteobacteria bacterium]